MKPVLDISGPSLLNFNIDKSENTFSSFLQFEQKVESHEVSFCLFFLVLFGNPCCSRSKAHSSELGFAMLQTCTYIPAHTYDKAQRLPTTRLQCQLLQIRPSAHSDRHVTSRTLYVKLFFTFCRFVLLSCFLCAELLLAVLLEFLRKSMLSSLDTSD